MKESQAKTERGLKHRIEGKTRNKTGKDKKTWMWDIRKEENIKRREGRTKCTRRVGEKNKTGKKKRNI